jgi:hypothetical protein
MEQVREATSLFDFKNDLGINMPENFTGPRQSGVCMIFQLGHCHNSSMKRAT